MKIEQILARLLLADEVGQRLRAQRADARKSARRAEGDVTDPMHIDEHVVVADFVDGAFELADHEWVSVRDEFRA
jgi:hypothetical protein